MPAYSVSVSASAAAAASTYASTFWEPSCTLHMLEMLLLQVCVSLNARVCVCVLALYIFLNHVKSCMLIALRSQGYRNTADSCWLHADLHPNFVFFFEKICIKPKKLQHCLGLRAAN